MGQQIVAVADVFGREQPAIEERLEGLASAQVGTAPCGLEVEVGFLLEKSGKALGHAVASLGKGAFGIRRTRLGDGVTKEE